MKKLISATLAASLALSLAACGSSASTDSVAASSEAASTESTAASSEAAESTAETSELAGTTLKVAASPTPHAEILNVAKEILAEQGIDLEVVEFSDYVQPNLVTESGEVDANYFQHTPYLEAQQVQEPAARSRAVCPGHPPRGQERGRGHRRAIPVD